MLHIEGTTVLAISVDTDGTVTCVKVISGHPLMFGVTTGAAGIAAEEMGEISRAVSQL